MLVLVIGTLLVGIAEETTFREIVVRALRGSTGNEFVVMLMSSLLFGVIHAVNILNGAEVGPTITQIFVATISGASLYITLRLAGNVFVPILLHALVDYSILGAIGELGTAGTIAALVHILTLLVTIAGAIAILVSSMRAREQAALGRQAT